ncbi:MULTISPECIES: hypothetical protein [Streptomyces]|uniref:hypothetical protein n=1 Tax=Streptomyces TaxID=1883 RepID=UPI0004BD6DC7|nr:MULTISPECIES: hypothetical protein [Streptomyces]KJY18975.1 hypothetical protein VR43_22680 [Streptomyces sp. NRRL S-104]KOU38875.1 hypothetical protein ADK53_11435 [Streptomyces sp. WM6373]KOU62892.1 hypothetical protein ADK96_25230 [Streptomyces sp. IGB124]KOU87137.1 hypothetical protein ADK61_04095 [Streptomyces sp. XY66]KOU94571.1 hypothetical protein ADK93_05225 [Streptomyces sp. XY58]
MDGTDTEQVLASKWDLPLALFSLIRVAFGDLPVWAKAVVFGLIGSVGVWTAISWLRGRRSPAR